MSYSKRKTTKKKSRKTRKKKKHLNPGAFFAIVILILLVAIIYYFYQYEQQKKQEQKKVQHTEIRNETQPGKPEKKPVASPKAPSPSVKKENRKDAPSVPTIIDYTNLEYPVSYSSRPEQLIFHTGHTVSYNKNWKIPNWVSYELTCEETMGSEKRQDKFTPDPHVKEGSATIADYRNSGYDRGHMVPAADMKWSNATMQESFYFSNICPQDKKLNQQRWKDLENKVRHWAISDSAIIVICGPIVNKNPKRIGSNKVVVPHGFFKVILSPFTSSPKAIGFVFDNAHCTGPLRSHAVSIDSVESITGLDFFSPLPDEIEDLLEAHVDTMYWGI